MERIKNTFEFTHASVGQYVFYLFDNNTIVVQYRLISCPKDFFSIRVKGPKLTKNLLNVMANLKGLTEQDFIAVTINLLGFKNDLLGPDDLPLARQISSQLDIPVLQ